MRLGIFARTFTGCNLDEVLTAVVSHGMSMVQFNLTCAGLATLPELLEQDVLARINAAFQYRKVEMAAVSGTYNLIDPDHDQRDLLTRRARHLIASAVQLGTGIVTLCTGTCDPQNMWRAHPDNDTAESWRKMIGTLEELIPIAEAHDVVLGIEPERGNVVNSARKARRLLDEVGSRHLGIVLDGANLWDPLSAQCFEETLTEAFELLGPDVAVIHIKEIPASAEAKLEKVGAGRMAWKTYFDGICSIGFNGPIIIHNVTPAQVDDSVRFVTAALEGRGINCIAKS